MTDDDIRSKDEGNYKKNSIIRLFQIPGFSCPYIYLHDMQLRGFNKLKTGNSRCSILKQIEITATVYSHTKTQIRKTFCLLHQQKALRFVKPSARPDWSDSCRKRTINNECVLP